MSRLDWGRRGSLYHIVVEARDPTKYAIMHRTAPHYNNNKNYQAQYVHSAKTEKICLKVMLTYEGHTINRSLMCQDRT